MVYVTLLMYFFELYDAAPKSISKDFLSQITMQCNVYTILLSCCFLLFLRYIKLIYIQLYHSVVALNYFFFFLTFFRININADVRLYIVHAYTH